MAVPARSRYPCGRCGYLTLIERGALERCEVCGWVDDAQAGEVWGEANGVLPLTLARSNYAEFGAADVDLLAAVRPPADEEFPPSGLEQLVCAATRDSLATVDPPARLNPVDLTRIASAFEYCITEVFAERIDGW